MKLSRRSGIIILFFVILLIAGYAVYLRKYQQLVNEGTRLADQHCIAINPLIIQRKRAYIDGMKTLMASGSAQPSPQSSRSAALEAYLSYQDQYLSIAKEYVVLEKEWLRQQDMYLKRSDVMIMVDPNIREAMDWQYKMYRAEYESTEGVVKMFQEKDTVKLDGLTAVIARADRESRIAQQAYDLKWRNRPAQQSFRDRFISIPPPQCPEKNYEFPNVEEELGI
jgi:hypothetical protein